MPGMALALAHELYGDGKPVEIVILHGLLGSSRNWRSAARNLGERYGVAALDLRNHGASPHHPSNRYDDLVADVLNWIDDAGCAPVTLLGHSLGGKVAMAAACRAPERVSRLVVVDIAPVDYPPRWEEEFSIMERIDPGRLRNRKPVEEALAAVNDDWAFRKFLASNLVRNPGGGGFRWQVNLPALHAALPELMRTSLKPGDRYAGPVLAIRGGASDFVTKAGLAAFRDRFSNFVVATIASAAHRVHAEAPEAFVSTVTEWLERNA